jgi:hypothetical protein
MVDDMTNYLTCLTVPLRFVTMTTRIETVGFA